MTFDISSMLNPKVYDHPVKSIELIETHISWVLLTGDFAYKIKKPVNFGFLDFSTLEKRHTCCNQELRLNRRMAPDIYLDVVSITGTHDKPVISGEGEVVEYAVKMSQFPQSFQLDHMLMAGELGVEHMDSIARMVAKFHQAIQIADDSMDYGNKDRLYRPVEENFIQINEHLNIESYVDTLNTLQQWSKSEHAKLESVFDQRKRDGFIRECHGDMHLRNLVWLDDRPIAFDCIEFSADLRWIDVISEVAFLVMDLQDRQQYRLASRFINSYLEATGDYSGLSVLSFYLCYRALVRAKVDALRLEQKNIAQEEREKTLTEFESYLELANSYTRKAAPKLIIMRGMSASGKSTVSQYVVDELEAIRVRSDVERKRLFDIPLDNSAPNEIDAGIYSKLAIKQTYEKLAELASFIIGAGYSVVIDAAFLNYEQREIFQLLANRLGVAFIILEVTASAEVLKQRIINRKHDVSDADLAVLEHQLSNWKPLRKNEINTVITVSTEEVVNIDTLIKSISMCGM